MELNKFFESLNNGARWDVGVSINRSNALPLDANSVFSSKTAAENYAKGIVAEGQLANAYPGMILSVVEDTETVIYYIDANMNLQPVGNTKDVMAYIGSIPEGSEAKTIIEYINAKTEGIATDTALQELQTALNNIRDIVVGTSDVDGLVNKVAENAQAITDEVSARKAADEALETKIAEALQAAKDYADTNDADTIYDDTDLQTRVAAIEGDYLTEADKYDDTEVRELIAELDEAIGDTENGLVKDIADNKSTIEAEVERATAKEAELAQAIAAIDFIDEDELAEALEPINTALAGKAAQADLEVLQGRVDAFLTGEGTEAALDSLQELIEYIDAHDGADLTEMIATINAIEGKLAGIDSTVVAYVTAAIDALKIGDYAKAADLTALAGRVEALEAKPFDTYATKTEVQDVDDKFADYTNTSDLNTALAGKVNTSDFDTFKDENTTAIGTAKSEAIAAAAKAVEDAGYAVATDVAETYATKDELAGVKTTAEAAATKSYVDTELGKKANADVVYTKSEIDLKIGTPGTPAVGTEGEDGYVAPVNGTGVFASTYSKAELNAMLDKIEGGSTESAASVARQLDEFKSTTNNKLGLIDQKDAAQDTAIETAQTQANKGVADAAKAQSTADSTASALAILTDGAVKTNTNDINTIKGIVGIGTDVAENSHATRIGKLEAADASHSAEFNTLKGRVEANEGLIANKANAADVYTKTAADGLFAPKADTYTKTEVDNAVAAAITGANLGDYAKVTDVEAIYKAGVDGGEATGVLAAEITRAKAAEKANADAIIAIVGEDSGKTIRAIASAEAKAEVAALVGEAPEALDTIHEIASWIKNDETGAAAMSAEIAEHSGILAGFGGEGQPSTVLAAIATAKQEAIDAIPALAIATAEVLGGVKSSTAENKVAVGTDGTMEVNSMNVNKLVQTKGDTLILDGGRASELTE